MRFLFLIHDDEEAVAALTPDERREIVEKHMAYAAMLRERGAHVLGAALAGSETAAVVRPGGTRSSRTAPSRRRRKAWAGSTSSTARAAMRRSSAPRRSPASPGVAVEVLTFAQT
jgi:hypothetical protein